MVDWKKDIKLSDLLARKGDAEEVRDETPFREGEARAEEPVADSVEVEPVDEAAAETPFWKRDLSFRRQKDDVETDPDFEPSAEDSEQRSFFKRELSFRRAKHDDVDDAGFDEPFAEGDQKTPFWKRELSFGRRKDDFETAAEDDDVAHDDAEPVAEAGEEKTPFWKRELSFGRRRGELDTEDAQDHAAQAEAEPETEPVAERASFWKRELSFGRGKHDTVDTEPDAHAAESEERTPFWKRELSFGRRKHEFETSDEREEVGSDVLEAVPAAAEEKTPFWKRELSFGRRKGDVGTDDEHEEFASDEPEPFAAPAPELGVHDEAPVAGEEPVSEEPEPAVAALPDPDAFEDSDRELEPAWADEPEPLTSSVHEVVAEEETPLPHEEPVADEPARLVAAVPEPEADEETPFWKRELKFGRRRGDAALEPPPLPGPERTYEELSEFGETEQREKKPFFKRELSFRRAKDPDFDTPKADKRSFFRRELSFGRGKQDSELETELAVPASEKQPFFKRELSFRRGKGGDRELGPKRSGGRTKQLVGLKVGASQIAAARIMNNASPELVQLARQPIEQGIVVGGELRDPDALAEALRDFFAKYKLPNRNVRLGIGNNRIGVRSFEISGVHDPKQLENAVRFRAQEALPIPLDEAVLDYHVVDESVSPTGIRTYRVLLVVAYRELVDRYVAACRDAGLRLVGIDLEAFALLRALSPPPSEGFPEDTALVAVSIGHDRSTFAVSNGSVCEFTRVLDWGGSSLNTAIARALDVTPSQAEPIKRTLALNRSDEGASAPSDEATARAEEALRLELQSFARELVSSLHFYQNQPGSLAIGSITLTGGTAHLPGLAAELQRLIGVKVRVGDPLRRVKTAKRVEAPEQVGSLAVAIGLGIED